MTSVCKCMTLAIGCILWGLVLLASLCHAYFIPASASIKSLAVARSSVRRELSRASPRALYNVTSYAYGPSNKLHFFGPSASSVPEFYVVKVRLWALDYNVTLCACGPSNTLRSFGPSASSVPEFYFVKVWLWALVWASVRGYWSRLGCGGSGRLRAPQS